MIPAADPGAEIRGRNVALDGLRGVAALVVVLGHTLAGVMSEIFTLASFAGGPFGLVVNGDAAVHVFFVLSGLVLSASLVRNHETGVRGWPGYLVRRAFRLHPPYVAAVLFAWGATYFYPDTPSETLFIEKWGHIRYAADDIAKFVLQPPGAAGWLLPVGWTLRVESIFSCLLPVMVAARRYHIVAFAVVMLVLLKLPLGNHWSLLSLDFAFGMFLSELAADGTRRAERGDRLAGRLAIMSLAAGCVLLHLPNMLGISSPDEFTRPALLIEAVGAALVVGAVLYSEPVERFLSRPFFRYLGRISYSLYLVHIPIVIVIASHADTGPVAAKLAVGALCIAASMLVATVMERFVEAPSQRKGRVLAKSIDARLAGNRRS